MSQQCPLAIVTLIHPDFIVAQPGVPTFTSVTIVAQQFRQVIVARIRFDVIVTYVPTMTFALC
jgi:hypothetical protein